MAGAEAARLVKVVAAALLVAWGGSAQVTGQQEPHELLYTYLKAVDDLIAEFVGQQFPFELHKFNETVNQRLKQVYVLAGLEPGEKTCNDIPGICVVETTKPCLGVQNATAGMLIPLLPCAPPGTAQWTPHFTADLDLWGWVGIGGSNT